MANAVKLKPIGESFSLKDRIYGVLRTAILDMDIYAEDADLRLDERTLAARLGISRTPVREALVRLSQDGFVEVLPRKGVFVRRKSLEEVLEMITVWAALESMAARLAVENASDEELSSLRGLAAARAPAGGAEISEYSDANIEFHQRILSLSGCGMLRQIADSLFLHMRAVRRRAMQENDRAKKSVVDHMEIIEALEARDAELASACVREHTMRLHDHVRRRWAGERRRRKAAQKKEATVETEKSDLAVRAAE